MMTTKTDDLTSTAVLWGIASLAGVVVAAVAIAAMGYGILGGLFFGAVVAVLVAVVLTMAFGSGHAAVPTPTADTAARVSAPEPVAQPAAAPMAQPAAAPVAQSAPVPTPEPAEGQRPATLQAPRGGTADDLKKIKGVGPKLEKMLHGMGIYHFDQIAAWTAAELSWVDDNLTGFKGRASRDDWQAQAKLLAAGGETEFSARVGKGDVY